MQFFNKKIIFTIVYCFFFFSFIIGQVDSLSQTNKKLFIEVDYGFPLFNKLKIQNEYDLKNQYFVNSTLKSQFYLGLKYQNKKINLGLNASYFQNEFTGRKFEIEGFDGSHSQNIIYRYNIIQKVKYDYCNVGFSFGLNHHFKKKNDIEFNLHALFTCFYKSYVFNYYSSEQFGYDTTLILAKNVKADYNSGVIPRFAIDLKYNFWLTDRLAFNASLLFYYSYTIKDYSNHGVTYAGHGVFPKNSAQNPYGLYYNAYTVLDQKLLSVLVGLRYRIL